LISDCNIKLKYSKAEYNISIDHEVEKKVIDAVKPPHKAIKKVWNKLTRELITGCLVIKDDIMNFKEENNHDLFTHLFFDKEYGKLILSNLDDITKDMTKLQFEIEKTKLYYDNIKK